MLFKDDEVARAEAMAVRQNAGWYRWTHDLVEVIGPDAERFLDWVMVNRIAGLPVLRGRYTTMLDEQGQIIDDLMVYNRGKGVWWLSTLYGPHMMRWFDTHRGGFDIECVDQTAATDMYAIQGPNSDKIMNELLDEPIDDLRRFQMINTRIAGEGVAVARGGFTGELGYEIYCWREESPAIEAAIAEAAAKIDAPRLSTLEVYVRSLPMEKGLALRQDYKGLTPYEANLGWSVHLDKDFVGKEALVAAHEAGERRAFVGLELERESYEDIAQKEIIRKRGVPVGYTPAFIYGYTVDKNIGFGVVDARKCPIGTRVTIGCNDSPAIVVEPRWC